MSIAVLQGLKPANIFPRPPGSVSQDMGPRSSKRHKWSPVNPHRGDRRTRVPGWHISSKAGTGREEPQRHLQKRAESPPLPSEAQEACPRASDPKQANSHLLRSGSRPWPTVRQANGSTFARHSHRVSHHPRHQQAPSSLCYRKHSRKSSSATLPLPSRSAPQPFW